MLDMTATRAGAGAVLRGLHGGRSRRHAAQEKQLLSEMEYREAQEKYGEDFTAKMGAEAVRDLLQQDRPGRR
jgi:DNA-directed RNA polymerase beta' subunit